MSDQGELELAAIGAALAGTYSVERELGRGGMGIVYLARDVFLDRPVAIKVLHPALASRDDLREHFLREARTGAKLSHPNIVPIYAVDEAAGYVYFVMGLVDGESAGVRLRRQGPLPTTEVEGIIRDVGWALAHAHAMGIVHRDVTLDNILIERSTGRALLADFGIAAEIDRGGEGPLLGTPAYLAPELIHGDPPSPQSDLYALGVTAWALLAGRLPFTGDDTASILVKQVTMAPPSLSDAAPGASARLVRAIERALAKDPAARGESIEAWLRESDTAASGMVLAAPLSRWLNRWQVVRPFYALGMSLAAMIGLQSSSWGLSPYGGAGTVGVLVAMLRAFATVFTFVVIVHAGIELAFLRRLSRSGYGLADLQLALARHRADHRHDVSRSPALLGRVVNDLAWLGGVTYVMIAGVLMRNFWLFMSRESPNMAVWSLLTDVARWAYIFFWTGLGLNFLVPSFHFRPDGLFNRLVERFWRSPLASGLLRLASFGLGSQGGAEQTLHRPTELVLDLAIGDLFAALPASSRAGLAELPSTAEGLRNRIGEMKELIHQLDSPDLRRHPELHELRDRLAERQSLAVTGLEHLRLQLARLSGETHPTGALTQQLHDARALEAELLEELGAHTGLRRQLARRRSTPTIAPTPTPA